MNNNTCRTSLVWNKHFVKDNIPQLSKMIHMDLSPLFSIIKNGKYKGHLKFVPSKLAEKQRSKYIKTNRQKNKFAELMGLSFATRLFNCGIFFPHKPKNMSNNNSVTVSSYDGVHVYPIGKYINHCNQIENTYNKVHHSSI